MAGQKEMGQGTSALIPLIFGDFHSADCQCCWYFVSFFHNWGKYVFTFGA